MSFFYSVLVLKVCLGNYLKVRKVLTQNYQHTYTNAHSQTHTHTLKQRERKIKQNHKEIKKESSGGSGSMLLY